MITLDTTKRAARMLSAGRLTATFRSPTGRHITLTVKCRGQVDGRWTNVRLADAKMAFIEVPNESGYNDKVGKLTSRGFTPDPAADEARIYCAKQLLRWVAGEATAPGLEIMEEERCGRCGRALTDPVSIERGIGPECYGHETGSEHQVKVAPTKPERATVAPADLEEAAAVEAAEAIYVTVPGIETPVFRALVAPSDGRDKKNVAFGHGGWEARAQVVRDALAADTSPAIENLNPALGQLTDLPGASFEDIFAGCEPRVRRVD